MIYDKTWSFYKVDKKYYYKIIIYDGFEKYIDIKNKWYLIGDSSGRLILENSENKKIIIDYIDIWKTILIKN